MEMTLSQFLRAKHPDRLCAKNPIDPAVFSRIPFFDEVFDKELQSLLVLLAGAGGTAHIEHKAVPPGDRIIGKGEFDMMIFWLTEGCAEVWADIGGKPTIVKKYDQPGHCFGELAIIDESERTADVLACRESGASIIEIDWSITMVARELEAKFNKLLMKTVNRKLMESYELTKKTFRAIKKIKSDYEAQEKEMRRLKTLLEKHNIPCDGAAPGMVPEKLSAITEELDRNIKRT